MVMLVHQGVDGLHRLWQMIIKEMHVHLNGRLAVKTGYVIALEKVTSRR
jgi:hypothetical protein